MTYYPTLGEDIRRAREILAKGKAELDLPAFESKSVERRLTVVAQERLGGTIFGADVYAAYKLLESFVAEIETRQKRLSALRSALIEITKTRVHPQNLHLIELAQNALDEDDYANGRPRP